VDSFMTHGRFVDSPGRKKDRRGESALFQYSNTVGVKVAVPVVKRDHDSLRHVLPLGEPLEHVGQVNRLVALAFQPPHLSRKYFWFRVDLVARMRMTE